MEINVRNKALALKKYKKKNQQKDKNKKQLLTIFLWFQSQEKV